MVSIVDDKRRGIALGAAGYLTKPIDRERLHRLVRRFQAPTRATRVLMVEDDASQRERMLGWLERPHWIVREAENGQEALDLLYRRHVGGGDRKAEQPATQLFRRSAAR